MFDSLKKRLYLSRMKLLLAKGLEDGSITPFDDEIYRKMNHTYINCLPVSIEMKYLRPTSSLGKCLDRSLYMFLCFDDAILVRGDTKDLELRYGKENAIHGWVEQGDYCYDPSLLLRFKKETFYKLFKPSNVSKVTSEEYRNYSEMDRQFYDDVVNTKLDDFKPNGRKRINLCTTIPLVRGIAEIEMNTDFIRDLNNYLESIQYDEEEIAKEMNVAYEKYLKKINEE